ncbi:MAG: ATP-binding protein, partial [Candidatus Entotheonellia bacterium]
ETQAVLDTLVESLPTARLLLLATYRPEYQHGWGSKTAYTQLRLDPLPREQAQVFLDVLLGDGSGLQPLKQQVIALTQGNPFFLEESVQSLIETGGLGGARGAYRLGHPLQTLRVPDTVQAVLAARIDRLPPQEKQLLQTAAVIGHEVPFPVLRAIAELSDEDLSRSLSHLQAAEFLYETRLFPQHEFTFKHALTQQVAYETLLQEGRRVLHARVVAAIEALAGDRVAEQVQRLAHHAFQGEIWDKAVAYFRQAGDKALARSAFREAVTFFEQALVALKHLPGSHDAREQAVDLHLALHHALSPLEEYGRFFDHLREAEILAEALHDQRRLGLVLASMCSAFRVVQGDHDRAVECGQRALAIATAVGEFGLKVVSNHFLGQTYRSLGDYRRAMEYLRMAAASLEGNLSCEPFGLGGPVYVASLNYLVWCLADLGEFAEGIASAEEAVRIAEALDQPEGLLLAYRSVGYLYLVKGDLHKAISMLERGLALCQAGDLPGYVPWTASSLGYAYVLSGCIAEAIPLLEQAVQRPTSTGKVGHAVRVAYLGEAYLAAGRIDEAIELARHALEFSREHKERGHQVYALRLLGEIGARREPPESDQAGGYYRQALALAEEVGMQPLVAHCYLGLGRLYAQIGRRERARAELSSATGLYRAMEMTFWLPQAEAALIHTG